MADQWNNPCDGGQSSPHNAEWIAIVSNVDVDWRDELRARNHLVLVLILILVLQGSPGALSLSFVTCEVEQSTPCFPTGRCHASTPLMV